MQFGELIKSLTGKAGVKQEDETLKRLLSFAEVMQTDLPEEFFKPLEENLYTEESAKAHLKPTLYAEALNGLDGELNKVIDDNEFDDQTKAEIKAITKNTNEKARRLASAIQKLTQAKNEKIKAASNKPKDAAEERQIEALNEEIKRLNRATEDIKTMHKAEVDNLQSRHTDERKKYSLRSKLAGKPLPKNGLPQEVNLLTAETLINNALAKNGLRVHLDEFGNQILKQVKDGAEVDYYVNNKIVNFDDLVDRTLADNKFVQINDPAPQNGSAGKTPLVPSSNAQSNSTIAEESRLKLESLMGAQI